MVEESGCMFKMPIQRTDGNGVATLSAAILSALRKDRRTTARLRERPASPVIIASYNVHKCVGVDNRYDPARVAGVIAEIDADIIALQEVDRRFGNREGTMDLVRLEQDCGLIPVPLSPTARGHGWHGNVVLFRQGQVADLHQIRLDGVEPRGALIVDLDLKAGPLRVVAAHFGLLRRCRNRQAEAILAAVQARDPRPTLIMGDLNEWRLGRRSALRPLGAAFGPLDAALPSFPS
ncbi:MAG: EEP domain-containing protein, partial [Alphaproteobacteria bacterium]